KAALLSHHIFELRVHSTLHALSNFPNPRAKAMSIGPSLKYRAFQEEVSRLLSAVRCSQHENPFSSLCSDELAEYVLPVPLCKNLTEISDRTDKRSSFL